jgi:hypothetical protein
MAEDCTNNSSRAPLVDVIATLDKTTGQKEEGPKDVGRSNPAVYFLEHSDAEVGGLGAHEYGFTKA